MTTDSMRWRVACFRPVPGSTAASAVFIGALADEPPLDNGTPGEAPGATREGACGPRDGQIHGQPARLCAGPARHDPSPSAGCRCHVETAALPDPLLPLPML
jgi:hypothetical protein